MIVEDNLVGRAQLGPFYSLLVARTEASGDYDYEYTGFAQNAFGVADAEEAFDHAQSFRAAEPDGERVKWQKVYLEYMLEEGLNAEAEQLVASIESELSRRYARPAWLRLAKARLELRSGKGAQAVTELKRFTGGDVSADISKVSAPSAERLSAAVALLRDEHYESSVPQLLEATYAQLLALGQYQTSYFVGLAGVAFDGGDAERGDKLLRLLVALSAEETKDEAASEVAALPGVSERFAALSRAETPDEANAVVRAESLRLAAETEGSFGRYEQAINFRTTLSEEKPDDYSNRVELARLLAATGRREEAVAQLSKVISDRRAPRAARWQAVWVAPELTGGRRELWDSLMRASSAGGSSDEEMSAALKGRELWAEGRAGDAADVVARAAADDPNPLLAFFRGVLDAESGHVEDAARAFTAATRSQASADILTAFGADEESALDKLIRLRLSTGQPFAALKLASLDTELGRKSEDNVSLEGGVESVAFNRRIQNGANYLTLKERVAERRDRTEAELLALLSAAAEQVKDFYKAIEFERARL
ncbi:MAG: hypothetical protein DMF65_02735, partial [Acidobacteria bacterium]